MEFNMNGNNKDTNYRYKMPCFNVTIAGKGNGIYTIFNNINDISRTMNHPSDVIFRWIASVTGSNYIPTRDTLTGTHKSDDLQELILGYIKYLVMCPKCGIPETVPKVVGVKNNASLKLCCSACKNEAPVKSPNKTIDKGVDIIIKYLNAGGEWSTTKGTMVQTSKTEDYEQSDDNPNQTKPHSDVQSDPVDDYNPFDSM
jgi:translation initiation factor 2 beta subunit (eIF-2beta)/eIF-5